MCFQDGGGHQQGQHKQGKEIMALGLTKSRSTALCSPPPVLGDESGQVRRGGAR